MQLKTTVGYTEVYIDGSYDAPELLICLPGFLDGGNYEHIKRHRTYFAERGFLCVSFDPLGTFASPGDISLYSVTNYVRVIHDLVTHFGNKPTTLLGHSMGGTIALLASFEHEYIKKTISIMSPYNLATRYQEKIGTKRQTTGFRSHTRKMQDSDNVYTYDVPRSFAEDAMHYNMLAPLAHSTKPKLFIVGKEDSIVDPEEAKEGYVRAGEPKQLAIVDAYDHNYRIYPTVIDEIHAVIEKFI